MPVGTDKYGIHIGIPNAGDVDSAPTLINIIVPFKAINKNIIVITELIVTIIFWSLGLSVLRRISTPTCIFFLIAIPL